MGEKSDELGGERIERGIGRHAFEGGAVTALAALIVGKWGALVGVTQPWEQAAALSVLVGALGGIVKFVHEQRILDRLVGLLPPAPPVPPAAGAAGMILAAWMATGCAIQLGRVTPHEFHGSFGETIVACEVVGISWSAGDADICRNVEGGKVSKTFSDMLLGVVATAGQFVAGFFGGAGAGIQAALAPEAPQSVAPEPLPAIEMPASSTPSRDDVGTAGTASQTVRAPFQ